PDEAAGAVEGPDRDIAANAENVELVWNRSVGEPRKPPEAEAQQRAEKSIGDHHRAFLGSNRDSTSGTPRVGPAGARRHRWHSAGADRTMNIWRPGSP